MGSNTIVINDFTVLTTLPDKEPAQALIDFLADNEVYAFTMESDRKDEGPDAVDVRVPVADLDRAKTLLADYQSKSS